ncbi:MAG: HAMP domain-containing histidine kinase [Ignavibacteriaceae bacterium]|nr:HAMP domain-containing histidine kinase [Ignavibacteriaceae bacterium]
MKIFKILNSKIRYKLTVGFVFISLFVGVVSYIGFSTIRHIEKDYNLVSTSRPLVHSLEDMKFACLRLISSASEYAYIQVESKNAPQNAPIEQENNLIQQSCNQCHKAFSQYEHLVKVSFPELTENKNEVRDYGNKVHIAALEFIEMKKQGISGTKALDKKEEMEVDEMGFLKAVNHTIDHANDRLEKERAQLNYTISSSLRNIIILSGLTFFFSVLFGFLYSRSLSIPITKLTQQADNFRKGNLDAIVELKSSDEIGALGRSFNEMAERIKLLISQLEDEVNIIKQAEEEIKIRNEQLSRSNAEKDKFFSIIAHDLKSPFQGLLGLTEMMASGNEEFSKDELLEYGKSMHKSASTLFQLIENLLEWAQMQRGSISFTPKELNLSTFALQNIEIINQRAVQKGITISNEIPESLKVNADEKMVNTVLRNLLSNAVKFTKRDGKIIIRSKKTEDEMVEVSVQDTGVGMSEKDVKRLFKIEEKVSKKGTEGELSTGLGLLLCKEFVEKHGGKIWAESQQNVGSTFYFTLPIIIC